MTVAKPIDTAPVVICAALSGNRLRGAGSPHHPVSNDDVADEATAAANAGAAMVHCHARDMNDRLTNSPECYRALASRTSSAGADVVVAFSTGDVGGSSTIDERVGVLGTGPDVVSVSGGSFDTGGRLYDSNPHFRARMLAEAVARRVGVEFELFAFGQIEDFSRAMATRKLPFGCSANLVFGVPGSLPGNLDLLGPATAALPPSVHWSVTCVTDDISLHQAFLLSALARGGSIRVGLEDCPFVAPRQLARSNAEIVGRWVTIVRQLGRAVATPESVRGCYIGH